MPPESWSGNCVATSSSPTRRSTSEARASRSGFATPWISSPNATFSITVRWASSPKCWNTIETVWRRSSRSSAWSAPITSEPPIADRAGRRLDQPDQRPHERRLARAREAHHDEHLAGPDLQRDVAHGDRGARLLVQLGAWKLGVRRADDAVGARAEDLPHALRLDQRRTRAINDVGRLGRRAGDGFRLPRSCRPRQIYQHHSLAHHTRASVAPPHHYPAPITTVCNSVSTSNG